MYWGLLLVQRLIFFEGVICFYVCCVGIVWYLFILKTQSNPSLLYSTSQIHNIQQPQQPLMLTSRLPWEKVNPSNQPYVDSSVKLTSPDILWTYVISVTLRIPKTVRRGRLFRLDSVFEWKGCRLDV